MEVEIARRVELVFRGDLASRGQIERLCVTARRQNYRGVAVPSGAILLAEHFLENSDVKISCRVGFPNGSSDPDVKRYETEFAIDAGAHEIELLPSFARVADGDFKSFLREIRDVAEAADERLLKVAVDAWRWEAAVLRDIVQVVLDSGAQYLSVGEKDDLLMIRELCGAKFGILVSAGNVTVGSRLLSTGANLIAIAI